ncbi:MAG: 1-acyl-sn-glycerol-3-phosphate acyltransferase, partial [Bacteroidia bacterium]|nr:1-acyl-sn-glycerol-3-phosphate acyltransferase [Bacteroidia bacterium]
MNLGNFILKIADFLYRKKFLFWTGLALLLVFLGFGIKKVRITESIYSTLPKGESFQSFNNFIENKNISNQVVFSLAVSDTADAEETAGAVGLFADSLAILSKNYLSEIVSVRPDVEQEVYDYFYTNFPEFIDSAYYSKIDQKLIADSVRGAVATSYRQLTGPGSPFLKKFILNDPLFISSNFFKNLGASASKDVLIEDGFVYNKDKTRLLITAKTKFVSGNSASNVELHNILTAYKTRWNISHPQHGMDYFGTFEIAAENAIQIKKDSIFTITITLSMLILILFIYYRKLLIPFYFILPPVFGAFFAVGVMGYIHSEISAISLATGAVLLGIILDYSFHFFTHLRHTRSVQTTIKEISVPLITGSFTTITAFSALQFASSPVLQDFGLFAALSLSGAAVFVLVFLPVILRLLSFNYESIPADRFTFKIPKVKRKYRYAGLALIVGITIFFLCSTGNIKFDGELENMSFHSADLKQKEQELTGTNPSVEKRIYFFVKDKDYQRASQKNYNLYSQIEILRNKGEIKNTLSAAAFLVPDNLKQERRKVWTAYWEKRKTDVLKELNKAADSAGFSANAFAQFENWLSAKDSSAVNTDSLLKMAGLNNLVSTENGETTFITTVLVSNETKDKVKQQLENLNGVEIFDRAEVASSLLTMVKNDFNYILIISALIVFCTLLMIYGRIELALFSFFPMLVSWIWIIGIAGLLGIKFNFVNVVISTFIFGLGDDYSIFVTDGLLHNYKYGKRTLGSYSSAIILSAICTIIGTGVLIFAKHPAIHSVALISVLGISTILFISLIFQPILFELFIQGRVDRKKAPLPMTEFLMSVFEFSYWIIVCLSFYLNGLLLVILPVSRKIKAMILNTIISAFAKSVIYICFYLKKGIFQRENLDIKKPSLIIANHGSFLDILLVLMLNPRVIILVKTWVYKSPLFGLFIRYAGYVYKEEGAEANLETIKKRIADGYSVVIFPEGTRSEDGEIKRFHKGAFYLAQELQLDITPILIHSAYQTLPKGDYMVKKGALNLKILPRIEAADLSWGPTYRERSKNISSYFKKEYNAF